MLQNNTWMKNSKFARQYGVSHPNTELSTDTCIGVINIIYFDAILEIFLFPFFFLPHPMYFLSVSLSCCFFSLHCGMVLTVSIWDRRQVCNYETFFLLQGSLLSPTPVVASVTPVHCNRTMFGCFMHLQVESALDQEALCQISFLSLFFWQSQRPNENHRIGVTEYRHTIPNCKPDISEYLNNSAE